MTEDQNQVEWAEPESVVLTGWVKIFLLVIQFLILALSIFILVMSFTMRVLGDHHVILPGAVFPMPEGCMSKMLFGVSCPGCGLTRAMISLSHGEWGRAWMFNPTSFLLYPFLILQIPWRLLQISRLIQRRPVLFSFWLFVPILTIVGVLISQWLIRLVWW